MDQPPLEEYSPTVSSITPHEIVRKAIEEDAIDLLLLGKQEYRYLPYWSSAYGDTDLPDLLEALHGEAKRKPELEVEESLTYAIQKILKTYEGLLPTAECIFYESYLRSESLSSFNLPLEEIAVMLRDQIEKYKISLFTDKSGRGVLWKDGLLGVLRQLNIVTQEFGGPSFFDVPLSVF